MRRLTLFTRAMLVFVLAASVTLFSGCSVKLTSKIKDADMISISHKAAAGMISQSKDRLDPGQLIVTSFADIDNLKNSSTLGRIIAQQVGSGFSSRGHPIVELLLRDTVYIGVSEGEFLLSRALKDLSIEHDAQAVIVGIYAVAENSVYVTTKLIRASDSVVIASEDFVLPLGPDTRKLVGLDKKFEE